MRTTRIRTGAIAAVAAFSLTMAACGSDDPAADPTDDATTAATATDTMTEPMATDAMTEPMDMMEPIGAACDQIPTDGEGSSAGMADDPVATAASNNPLLSTLVTAVTTADLGDTLNSAEALTVFAPINDAFAAVDADALDALLADTEGLTGVLTLHVAEGQMDAAALGEAGTVDTLAGGQLEFDGDALTVTSPDGTVANVVCGNVQTANATVHLIDAVLFPAS